MDILSLNVAGTILISIVIFIRCTMANRIPRSMMKIVWLLPLLRLLIPVEIPFYLNIGSIIDRHLTGNDNAKLVSHLPDWTHQVLPDTVDSVDMATSTTQPQGMTVQSAYSTWFYVWMAGVCILVLFYVAVTIYSYREFRTSLSVQNAYITKWMEMHCSFCKIAVRSFDRISTPLTYGMIHPVILLPSKLNIEDTKTLSYVLEHEYVHIRSYDVLYKLFFLAAACVYWFNPMVWLMMFFVNKDIELACDEKVIRHFGAGSEKVYAGMLVSLEACRSNITIYSGFSRNAVKERIGALINRKKASVGCVLLTMALVVCSIGLFATSAQATFPQKDSSERSALSEYVGSYVIDAEATEANLEKYDSLLGLFGTGLGIYGAYLNINADGTLSFEIGAGPVMEGTWETMEEGIYSQVSNAQGMIAPEEIHVLMQNGKVCFRYFDEIIYWKRVSGPAK